MQIQFVRWDENVQKIGRSGSAYTVNTVHGIKTFKGKQEAYSRDYFPNPALDQVFRNIQPGTFVMLTFDTDQYKSLINAQAIGAGAPPVQAPMPTAPSLPPLPQAPPLPQMPALPQPAFGDKGKGQFRDPSEIIRTDALNAAAALVTAALGAAAHDKLIKKTASLEALQSLVINLAAENEKFITGKMTVTDPKADIADLTGQEEDVEQMDVPA